MVQLEPYQDHSIVQVKPYRVHGMGQLSSLYPIENKKHDSSTLDRAIENEMKKLPITFYRQSIIPTSYSFQVVLTCIAQTS